MTVHAEPILAALRRVAILEPLPDAQLAELAATGRRLNVAAGEKLFAEGDAADRLFVVLSGACRAYRRDGDGGEDVEIARVGPGEAFGELALLDGGARSASVAATEPCELFTLDRGAFLWLVTGSPELLGRLFTALTTRVRESTERYVKEEIAARSVKMEMELARHKALTQLVAGVAHELNTPLGVANTAASIVKQNLAPDAIARLAVDDAAKRALDDTVAAIDLIERNVARATRLVQDFKKVSAGQMVDEIERADLGEVVRETVGLFGVGSRRLRLEIRLHDRLPAGDRAWVGRRGHLTQVLLNLLSNVERYAYPDGNGPIDVTIEATDRGFTIVVRDEGVGIGPEALPRVFDPFFTTGRSKGGTGLGLAIVHELVTSSLRGSVSVASEPGQFTEFRVTLPRQITE